MNTLKGWITTSFMAGTLLFSAMTANAGIIFAGLNEPTGTCSEPSAGKGENSTTDGLGGIIFAGITGIIFTGFTGIIFTGATDGTTQNCGIIFTGKA